MSTFQRVATLSQALREDYLRFLSEPQEWFLEELVRVGEVWEGAGAYAVFHEDTLVEFYAANDSPLRFPDLMDQRPFGTALCKSFDTALLDAVTSVGGSASATGHLFRKRTSRRPPLPENFRLERATSNDLEEAYAFGSAFFCSRAEVDQLHRASALWVGWNHAERVGCGVTHALPGSQNAVDVGMVVRADLRRMGFGSAVVSTLADELEHSGQRPICGCAAWNLASKTALEKAGFVSQHSLLRISF